MIPQIHKDRIKLDSYYSIKYINSRIYKSNLDKNNKKYKGSINKKSNIKEYNINIDKKILNKSNEKRSILVNNNSFNNSLVFNSNNNNNNKTINTSKSIISFLKNNYNNNVIIFPSKNKNGFIKNSNINDNNFDNFYKKINIINYKKKIPKNIINRRDNKKDYSGETSLNFSSNYNNNNSFNINSIDRLFCKPIKFKSSLNKSNKDFLNNKSLNLFKTDRIKDSKTNASKSKNFFIKLNASFSLSKNKKKIKINNNSKIGKNHFTLNIGKDIRKKVLNLKLNNHENNYKKINQNNYFQPKNIFSKFKTKNNKTNNKEDISFHQKFLTKNNQENKESKRIINYHNFINKLDLEKEENSKNDLNGRNETKRNEYNNNSNTNSHNNYSSFSLIQNRQNNLINSYNILSYTSLNTGTDNPINNTSQNILEIINIYSNTFYKGKKIRCIHDISKTGLSGEEKKVNQDRYFIFRNFVSGLENIFMGILDGHGYYGHEVSEYIKENLPMDLNRILKIKKLNLFKDDLSQTIKQTFEMENNSLLRNKQIDSNLSGTTCVSAIYTPEKLIAVNLGDSRCILGKKINDNEWRGEILTRDHKPNIPEEAQRIKSFGGIIRPMKDEDGNFCGPLRVYLKGKDIPGLAMTRSFGDYYASTAGTISIPEIREYIFQKEDKFLVLASDGLFEFIENDKVINIISEYYEKNDIVGCCEFLYKESYRKWIYEQEDTVDDITIILVFFEE